MPTMEKPSVATAVQPFAIEADNDTNSDIRLQGIPGETLRGAISAMRSVKDAITGEPRTSRDMVSGLGSLPHVPGQVLSVDPANLKYRITDVLYSDEDQCDRLRAAINSRPDHPQRITGKLKGLAPQSGTLDKHRMKSLCRELLCLIESGEVQLVKGVKPSIEQIDDLPGDYMLNPGATFRNSQPRYERDLEAWIDNLNRIRG